MEAIEDEDRSKRLKLMNKQTVVVHEQLGIYVAAMQASVSALLDSSSDDEDEECVKPSQQYRHMQRPYRHKFDHEAAKEAVRRDYLGLNPSCKEFNHIYRISKTRFQRMLEDFGRTDIKFYHPKYGACLEIRLLHPLKCLAFGEARHQSASYFQLSATLALRCCLEFDAAFKQLYLSEYLRLPDATDLKRIASMHEAMHGVPGMFGSLDCWHTFWKSCPKGWQGSYKNGKEKKPTIKMEALCDHHLWFWVASYGYAGTLNDINILDRSPLLKHFTDGSFVALEEESGVVPFKIGDEEFNRMFVLTDGIYPAYSRFVSGISSPVTDTEKTFTAWQEAARKDIERAFGVIQSCWKFTSKPIPLMSVKTISARMATCMMLHNMLVADRVMDGDVYARYDPSNSLEDCYLDLEVASLVPQEGEDKDLWLDDDSDDYNNDDYEDNDGDVSKEDAINDEHALNGNRAEQNCLWRDLENKEENTRLVTALKEYWQKNTRRL